MLCRALLNAVVEPHTVAALNTTISTMETLMGLASAPLLGWLMSLGLGMGGPWLGLSVPGDGGLCSVPTLLAVFAFCIPRGPWAGDWWLNGLVVLRPRAGQAAIKSGHDNLEPASRQAGY